MRYAVIGNSGSGKSTLAAGLASHHSVPCLDLDTIAWVPGQVAVPRDPAEAERDVQAFCAGNESFIVEGCYENLVRAMLSFRPTLIYLDVDLATCERNCRARPFEPHKYANPSEQDAKLEFLLGWVRDYYDREGAMSRREHIKLFDAYDGPKVRCCRDVSVGEDGGIREMHSGGAA